MPQYPQALRIEPDPAFDEFAAREPFFAVITDPDYLSNRLTDAARDKFFKGGADIVEALAATIALKLDPNFAPGAILEYGCGVGRLALPLAKLAARRGGRLTAVDRSASMLASAQGRAEAEGISNIQFERPGAVFGGGHPSFDFVTCYLVLQRLSPAEGLVLMRELIRTLLPGGIGVFQFPLSSRVSRTTTVLRRLRESSPVINRLVQAVRGDGVRGPFVPSHLYELNDVAEVFQGAGITSTHIVFDDHGDLSSAIAFVTAPETDRIGSAQDEGSGVGSTRGARVHASVETADGRATNIDRINVIDVRDVIRSTPIDALNEAAEQYFATLTTWEHHLAKPFAVADESPALLADVAVVLRGLDLRPGLRVLDFGAGTGWLSRALTQLGCSVVVLDVSKTALAMARHLYERVPVVGEQPAPVFLPFDGRRIELPDGSIDRVVCFHAFHHAPNPDEVIAEFGRIVAPGGIVAFAEPGPHHSRSAKSQFEMRSFRVVENDVDVHHLWEVAQQHGFADLRMFAINAEPLELTLGEYTDLCRGGEQGQRWSRETRRFLRNVSNFKLVKAGGRSADSSSATGLACTIHAGRELITVGEDEEAGLALRVTNSGSATWLEAGTGAGGVSIGVRIFDASGNLIDAHVSSRALTEPARRIQPGETLDVPVTVPHVKAGSYRLEFDCVAADVTWFAQAGSRPASVALIVR